MSGEGLQKGVDYKEPKKKQLVATTFFKSCRVELFLVDAAALAGYDALTGVRGGVFYIWLHPLALKRQRALIDTLIHEFTHVIEVINDSDFLDPALVDGCTLLAQTMGKQMGAFIYNLKFERGYRNPFKA